jgi:hypothetical protein
MGKQTKLREAQRHAAEQALAVRLRVQTPAKSKPAFIDSCSQFASSYRNRIEAYREFALRSPETWRCGLRVRSPEQRFRELVRFTFAKYPVARHLENAWIDETPVADGADAAVGAAAADFRRWYIIVGRGGSLYRDATHGFLSKLETHHFVNAPDEVGTTQRAFWYAIARAQNDNETVALRVARTKLVRFSVESPFWQDAARFFAHNPAPIHEMGDLIDYIDAMKQEDNGFTLDGRSLPALRRRMVRWHRIQREIVRGLRWVGYRAADAAYESDLQGESVIWRIKQIKTSDELGAEGHCMQHCVAVYQEDCITGVSSIWSLSYEAPDGRINKCLTIEVSQNGTIVQCRGFGNRQPNADEVAVLKRWAAQHDLTSRLFAEWELDRLALEQLALEQLRLN